MKKKTPDSQNKYNTIFIIIIEMFFVSLIDFVPVSYDTKQTQSTSVFLCMLEQPYFSSFLFLLSRRDRDCNERINP